MPYFEVEKYQVFKFSGNGLESSSAIIHASGGGYDANLVFLKEGVKMRTSDAGTLYFREKEFPMVIDLFRNEKPVHLNTDGTYFILTEQEHTGEHDHKASTEEIRTLHINGVNLRSISKGADED